MPQDTPLRGEPPRSRPPRVDDFDELDKKSVDNLVDYMKYIATASGITTGFYGSLLDKNTPAISTNTGKIVLFAPIIFWFFAILFSVIGILPRTYRAESDYEKEISIVTIRSLKTRYAYACVIMFLFGFISFIYTIAASLWRFYPFS